MTPDDIDRIERELSLAVPASYRSVLENYPYPSSSTLREFGLYDDPHRVIEANRQHLEEGWFSIDWPEDYFVIGDTGFGDTYFMVLGKSEAVYLADHEAGPHPIDDLEACLDAASPTEHADAQYETEREAEAALAARAERKKNKKWYQFWI